MHTPQVQRLEADGDPGPQGRHSGPDPHQQHMLRPGASRRAALVHKRQQPPHQRLHCLKEVAAAKGAQGLPSSACHFRAVPLGGGCRHAAAQVLPRLRGRARDAASRARVTHWQLLRQARGEGGVEHRKSGLGGGGGGEQLIDAVFALVQGGGAGVDSAVEDEVPLGLGVGGRFSGERVQARAHCVGDDAQYRPSNRLRCLAERPEGRGRGTGMRVTDGQGSSGGRTPTKGIIEPSCVCARVCVCVCARAFVRVRVQCFWWCSASFGGGRGGGLLTVLL